MSKSQREKGKAWEREVARRLRDVMPGVDVKRTQQSRQGTDGPDVDAGAYGVECKHGRRPPIRRALQQAIESAHPGQVPVAVIKEQNSRVPFVVLPLDRFLEMVGKIHDWSRDE